MADLMFGQDEGGTPLVTQPPLVDIGALIDNVGQKPAVGSGVATLPGEVFSQDQVMAQMQAAITAVGTAASKTYKDYKSPDTAKYLDAMERVRATSAQSAEDVDEQRKNFGKATQQERQAIQATASATIQKTNADQEKAQQIADWNSEINRKFGIEGNNDRLSDKVGTFHMLNDQYLNLEQVNERLKDSVAQDAAKLREETSVGFTDDPLRWMEGIFTIPKLTDTVEAGNAQINVMNNKMAGLGEAIKAVSTDINETVAASKDAKEARASTLPSITTQQAAALNNLAAAKATEDAAKADEKLAIQNSAFAGQKFAQAVTTTSVEHSAAVLKQQDNELQWRSNVQAVAKADSDAKAKLLIVEMMTKINDSQQMMAILRFAEVKMGLPEGSMTYSRYKAMPDPLKEYVIGQGMGFTGATPGNAFFNTKDAADKGLRPGPGLPVQTQRMLQYTNADLEKFQATEVAKGKMAGMSKEAQRAYLIQHVNERYADFQVNPATNPSENPFYEQAPSHVAAAVPKLAETKIGKILQPVITGTSVPNTDQVLTLLRDGAKDENEAAKLISQYYQLNMQVRNKAVDFQAFGLKPTNTYLYRAPLQGYIFGETSMKVDLTNETDVKNMLSRQRIRASVREAGSKLEGLQ